MTTVSLTLVELALLIAFFLGLGLAAGATPEERTTEKGMVLAGGLFLTIGSFFTWIGYAIAQ